MNYLAHQTLRLLKWLVIIYLTYVTLLYIFQRDLIYLRVNDDERTDELSYSLEREEAVLRGWVINPGKTRAILYYGGNAERLSRSIDVSKDQFSDFSVYLIHYRGYGKSTGEPTEPSLYADALAIYDDIDDRHDGIAVIGRSLGTGIATYVASHRDISHTVLITPYDSIANIASERYAGVPVDLLLKDRYESWKRIDSIRSRTLALIAESDKVVPRSFSDNLLSHFEEGTLISYVLDGSDHNDISYHPDYYTLIRSFLTQQ